MTDYEIQQLQLSQQISDKLTIVNSNLDQLNQTVSQSVYVQNHISGQMDLLNHSVYVANNYLLFIGVNVALIAAVLMFFLGKYVVSTKGG